MRRVRLSLDQFAYAQGLEVVVERRNKGKYEACVRRDSRRAEVKDHAYSGVLASTTGRGATPAQAKRHYARQVSGKVLVFDAMGQGRTIIRVPELS